MASVATLPPPTSFLGSTFADTESTSKQPSAADLGNTIAAAAKCIMNTWEKIDELSSSSSPDDGDDGTCASRPALQCRALVSSASSPESMLGSEAPTNSVSCDQSNTQQSEWCGSSETDLNPFSNSESNLNYMTCFRFTRRVSGNYDMTGLMVDPTDNELVSRINVIVPLEYLQPTINNIEQTVGRTKGGEVTQVEMSRLPRQKDWFLSTWGPTEDGMASDSKATASSSTV